MNAETLRKKIAKKEGAYALLYPLFFALSILYCAIARIRNKLYDWKILPSTSFPIPVISVGNVIAGGSGKTPLVESIYTILEESGFRPAIVTRGYKGNFKGTAIATPDAKKFGDEASVYALKNYFTVVSKDRAKGVQFAAENGANAVILDDGFQHRKVIPTINIVAIDPFSPFGDNRCLPLGLLREPLSGLERADAFVITRANVVSKKRLEGVELYLKTYRKPIFFGSQEFKHWINKNFQKTLPPEKEIDVFCGIGNPGQFVEMLIKMGFKIRNLFIFEDHHNYTEKELEKLSKLKNPVTTEKDLIKIHDKINFDVKVPVLRMEVSGLKEFLLNNIKNVEKAEEENLEEGIAPAGVSAFESKSLLSTKR